MSDIESIKKLIEEHKKWQAEGDEHFLSRTQQDLDKALVNAETAEETKLLLSGGANPNKRFLGENEAFTHAQSIEQMQALVDAGAEITEKDFVNCMWYDRSNIWREKCHFLLSHQVDNDQPIPSWNSMFSYVNDPINVNSDVWYAERLKSRWQKLATMDGRERDKMRRQGEQIKNEACSALDIDVKDVRYCKRIGDVVQIDYYTNHTDGHICLATVHDNKFTKIGESKTPNGYGPIEDFYMLDHLGKNLYRTFTGVHDGLLGSGEISYIGRKEAFLTIDSKGVKDGNTKEDELTQKISNKLQELKEKAHTDNIEDIPHAKTQVLRELAKDNLGKPKRSDADKQIIKSALDKATKNTRS